MALPAAKVQLLYQYFDIADELATSKQPRGTSSNTSLSPLSSSSPVKARPQKTSLVKILSTRQASSVHTSSSKDSLRHVYESDMEDSDDLSESLSDLTDASESTSDKGHQKLLIWLMVC